MFQIVSEESALVLVAVVAGVCTLVCVAYAKPNDMAFSLTVLVAYVALQVNAIQAIPT